MARIYICSTLANDQLYQNWTNHEGGLHIAGDKVLIKGGTGVANDRIVTPIGVMTEINDAELSVLESNTVFKIHRDAGFVTVQKRNADPEKVAGDMNLNDPSAPKTPSDYSDGDGLKLAS